MKTFYLLFAVGPGNISGKYWCEKNGFRWWSEPHGFDLDGTMVFATVETDDIRALDWSRTDIRRPDTKIGWLAPDGTHYGCARTDHGALAWLLGSSTAEFDKGGWINIGVRAFSPDDDDLDVTFAKAWLEEGAQPTEAQRVWLRAHQLPVPGEYSVCDLIPPDRDSWGDE